MEATKKRKLLIGFSVLALAGVAGYLWYRHKQDSGATSSDPASSSESSSSSPSGSVNVTTNAPVFSSSGTPLTNADDIRKFQTFANTKGAGLTVDGKWGKFTQTAWNKYGAEYTKKQNPTTTTTAPKTSSFSKGQPLYLGSALAVLYSYPAFGSKYSIGSARKEFFLDKPFAFFLQDVNSDWVKVRSIAYIPNGSNTHVAKVQDVYVPKKDVKASAY